MHWYVASLFILSFFYINAQEKLPTPLSQNAYDLITYGSHSDSILFEQAKHKLLPTDQNAPTVLDTEDARSTLALLAGKQNPYIPAVRFQISQALQNKGFKQAWDLAEKGHQLGDLPSTLTKATFLFNPDLFFCTSEYDPLTFELKGQQLLAQAAQIVPKSVLTLRGVEQKLYYMPEAIEQFNRLKSEFPNRLAVAFDASFDKKSKEEITKLESQADSKESFLIGCYFIKKYAQGDVRLDLTNAPARIVNWAQKIITAYDFDYELFKSNGAYEALEYLAMQKDSVEHVSASYLLGWIDYQRLDSGHQVDLEKLERNLKVGSACNPNALLLLASYTPDQQTLLAYADELVSRLDQIDPSLYKDTAADLIQLAHVLMEKDPTKFGNGLVRLLKHDVFRMTRDEICKNPDLAGELGIKLLHMRDVLVKNAKSKDRADHRKIHDAGLALTKAAADGLNDRAAWALVEHSLSDAIPASHKNALAQYAELAIIITQSRLETGMGSLVTSDYFSNILRKIESVSISEESNAVLAQWHLVGVPNLLERDEVKAVEYVTKTKDPVAFLQRVLDESLINDPCACMNAAIALHKKSAKAIARDLFFGKAILHGSTQVRKAIAEYCLQYSELVPMVCKALEPLYTELASTDDVAKAGQLSKLTIQPLVNKLMAWATGTYHSEQTSEKDMHPAAIMFFNNPMILSGLEEEKREDLEHLAEWAAINREYPEAIDAVAPRFTRLIKEHKSITKRVNFWAVWLKLYGNDTEKEKQKKQVYVMLDTLSEWSLERVSQKGLLVQDSSTHYCLANLFMENDPIKAVNHILIIDELIKEHMFQLPQVAQAIDKNGTYDLLRTKAAQGHDWACYALACIELNRLNIYLENHLVDHDKCFARIDAIKDMLAKAKTFDTSQLDQRLRQDKDSVDGRTVLTLGEIEYCASKMATKLNAHDQQREETAKRGCKALAAASQAGYPDAVFACAIATMNSNFGIGQDTLAAGINGLCRAMKMGNEIAQRNLAKIYQDGFAHRARCGGNITQAMLDQISDTFGQMNQVLPVLPTSDNGAPLSEFEQAVVDIKNKEKAAQALSVFERLAQAGDVRACVHLGIVYRDGMGVPACSQKATEYFVRALKESKKIKPNALDVVTVSIAYEGTSDLSLKDPEVAAYRCRFFLQGYRGNPNAINECLHDVEIVEQVLTHSVDPAINNLLYTSGLMHQLINVCADTNSLSTLIRIAKLCAKRALKVDPNQLLKDNNLAELTVPFAYLRDLVGEATVVSRLLKATYAKVESKEVTELIGLLEQMVAKGYLEPFEEVLGTLKVGLGILTLDKKLAYAGVKNWEHAESHGDKRAAYMWALVKLRSEQFAPPGFFVKAHTEGIEKLKALSASGHTPASLFLGHWYNENRDPVTALGCYKQMRIKAPSVVTGAVGFLESISRAYAKSTEDDRALINEAIAATQANKDYVLRGAFCASYLRIVKKYEGMSDEQAIDYIIKAGSNGNHDQHTTEFLKETKLVKHFQDWLSSFEKSKITAKDEAALIEATNEKKRIGAKAYYAQAYLLYASTVGIKNKQQLHKQVIESCDEALKKDPTLIDAEALKATVYYSDGMCGDADATQNMKVSVKNCCAYMLKNKLKLDKVPVLSLLLDLIEAQGAVTGSMKNGNIVTTDSTMQTLIEDIQWAQKIKKMLASVPAPKDN